MSSSTQEVCASLIAQGEKINAIKRWRTDTNCTLKEAKEIIEHFEATGVWISHSELPLDVIASNELSETIKKPVMTTSELQNKCATLVHRGEKISAIKLWRQQTDSSLKEAKTIIEQFEKNGSWSTAITPEESTPSPEQHQSKKSSDLVWWVLAAGIVVYQIISGFVWMTR